MLKFFRNIFKNKLGLVLTFALLGIIALAFAVGDVASNNSGSILSSGSDVASVGKEDITQRDLSTGVSQALNIVRRDNPTISTQAFIAQGGLQQVVEQLIDRTAIATFAQKYGLRAGNNLINSEIRQISAFRGTDGNFSEAVYKQALAQQNLSDAMVREDIRSGLLAQQLLQASTAGLALPDKIADRYALLFKERRIGSIGLIPSAAFLPKNDPSDADLAKYYAAHKDKFIRPERRVLRYAMIDESAVKGKIAPTDAEIRQRYERDKAKYAASVKRTILQLIVPTREAADAIRKKVEGGQSLEAAARTAGLQTSTIGPIDQSALAKQTSQAVAQAYFNASRGTLTQPAQGALGWYLGRVESETRQAGTTLEQATPEIRAALTEEKRVRALSDLASDVENELDGGTTLSDIAKQLNLTVETTKPVTADGRIYRENAMVPSQLIPVLSTAFQMEESSPQVADVKRGQQFLVYEVSSIIPSAAAPLKEIRQDVAVAWKLSEGDKAAKATSERILAEVAKGKPLAEAIRSEKVALPPAQSVNLTRQQLAEQQNGRVPPPLALLFSMAQGTTKKLEIGNDRGYYLVELSKVELGKLSPDDPLVGQARSQLSKAFSDELGQEFIVAIRNQLGVKRNPEAIETVRKQLVGER